MFEFQKRWERLFHKTMWCTAMAVLFFALLRVAHRYPCTMLQWELFWVINNLKIVVKGGRQKKTWATLGQRQIEWHGIYSQSTHFRNKIHLPFFARFPPPVPSIPLIRVPKSPIQTLVLPVTSLNSQGTCVFRNVSPKWLSSYTTVFPTRTHTDCRMSRLLFHRGSSFPGFSRMDLLILDLASGPCF